MNLREEILRFKKLTNILTEGKLEDFITKIKQSYDDTYDDIIEDIYNEDPSPSKKYFIWISKTYIERDQAGLDIDIDGLIEMVKYFDKNQHKFEKKDIYQYTYDEFIQKYEEAITKISKRELALSGVDKLYEDDKYVLVRPKNEEASCKYGANTKWCIASNTNNYFTSYSTDNLFFFIIDKLREPIPGKKKSPNYFKIAIQYEPPRSGLFNSEESYLKDKPTMNFREKIDKEIFLRQSQVGYISYWNAIDDEVSPSTVKKYIDKDILKKFIQLIKQYTYNVYLNFYDTYLKKKEQFDVDRYFKIKGEVEQKRSELKTLKKSYSATKAIRFVNETLSMFENLQTYLRVMKLPPKTFDEFLEFNKTKEQFYTFQKNKEILDKKLETTIKELENLEEIFYEMNREKESIGYRISFDKR